MLRGRAVSISVCVCKAVSRDARILKRKSGAFARLPLSWLLYVYCLYWLQLCIRGFACSFVVLHLLAGM